ncbi:MAG: polymerase sigma factor, sigma-70 family [Planctomycetota bacterium]|nr:polymerase sigma factor, sigma-70 family [Planctomycetota bacterium]
MPEAQADVLTPDEVLIGLAREGDRGAREELFRRHVGIAHRVAYRLLGHEQDAQDAVQDALVKALKHLEDFDGRSGFRTWLLRIVTNASLDSGRKRRRRPTIRIDEAETGGVETAIQDDPALGMHRDDLKKVLYAALDRLSPPIRATFVLFAEADMSYKDIAALQDVPVGTVMSRLHYARQKLQSYLDGVEGIS